MARLTISLLGPLLVRLGKDEVAEFGYDKVRALLAYLAVEVDRPQRREALAALLWPEQADPAARTNLRRALLTLRVALGDQYADPPFLLITRDTLQFNRASDHVLDVAAFQALLAGAAAVAGRPECAVRLYGFEEALREAAVVLMWPDEQRYEETFMATWAAGRAAARAIDC
jgi:DNA-binding SARP family transcriptional activator